MSHPVNTLQTCEKVRKIVEVLQSESHDGFPVVEESQDDDVGSYLFSDYSLYSLPQDNGVN